MYVFKDIDPDATFHYQMIPKWHLRNLNSIDRYNPLHFILLSHMHEKSTSLMKEWHPELMSQPDSHKFGFHKPWCTSVNHLHMHMMVGERKFKTRLQFNCVTFRSISDVVIYFSHVMFIGVSNLYQDYQ